MVRADVSKRREMTFLTSTGGSNLKIEVDGKEVCNNVAKSETKPGYVEPEGNNMMGADSHAGGHTRAKTHLSEINDCIKAPSKLKMIKPGQKWKQTGYYDFDKNKGM